VAARRFLWIVAALIGLAIAFAFAWRLAGDRMLRTAMTPGIGFEESERAAAPDYRTAAGWIARPGLASNPARTTPTGYQPAPRPPAAAFWVVGTTFFGRDRWNAPLDDEGTNTRAADFTAAQGSAFNGVAAVWSPRYRQATFGAFLSPGPDANAALDFAYADVARAFDAFVAANPGDGPILIGGHSQGALHVLRLLRERVRGTPLAGRVAAVYAVGWPVSLTADVPALGFPACTEAGQPACIASWQSWAAENEPAALLETYAATPGFTGASRRGTPMLCTNPLTGGPGSAPATANIGTLAKGALTPRAVGAACDRRGLLILTDPAPEMGPFVLPGGNYHAYDVQLFWANVRADAEARVNAWGANNAPGADRDDDLET
jgi:hypothetical protein